jgi:GNAT superfamily N-acetyltransferase
VRTIVAEDPSTGEILGQASWGVEGSETELHRRWASESDSWFNWLEGILIRAEKTYARYFLDKAVDYAFLSTFMSSFLGSSRPLRPSCLHCHLIVVDPTTQSKGVGKKLIDWGKDLATKEDLPLYLEATLEATGFYEKLGFSRLNEDMVVSPEGQEAIHIPIFVWEGEDRREKWLQRDETGKRWRWKEGVLAK